MPPTMPNFASTLYSNSLMPPAANALLRALYGAEPSPRSPTRLLSGAVPAREKERQKGR